MSATPNPPATIDVEAFSVSRTVVIAAPLSKVWRAITDPEHIAKWAGSHASISALEVGGAGTWIFEGYGTVPLVIEEVDPPQSIAYRWGNLTSPDIDPVASTVFRFALAPVEGGTELTVVETGFQNLEDPPARMEDNRGGWTSEIDELIAYLESAS